MKKINPEVGGYMGTVIETAGFLEVYNIEAVPKERVDFGAPRAGRVIEPYKQTILTYLETLKEQPNPPVSNVT